MGQPSPRKTDLVWKSGILVFEGKEVHLFKEKGSFYRLEEELVDFSARGQFTL